MNVIRVIDLSTNLIVFRYYYDPKTEKSLEAIKIYLAQKYPLHKIEDVANCLIVKEDD